MRTFAAKLSRAASERLQLALLAGIVYVALISIVFTSLSPGLVQVTDGQGIRSSFRVDAAAAKVGTDEMLAKAHRADAGADSERFLGRDAISTVAPTITTATAVVAPTTAATDAQPSAVTAGAWAPSTVKDDDDPATVREKLRKKTGPLFEGRSTPLEPPVHFRDQYDPLPPREGESFITFEQYLNCLGARLNVDRHARVEHEFVEANRSKTWPYLMVPATAEIRDVKALMCNISLQIRHLLYVQNGAVPAMTAFFDDTQRAFNFTERLKIWRYADNIGFAGAVNQGYRDALTYPLEEVPFYHLSNNDYRFPPGNLETMIPLFYEITSGDGAVMKALEEEVASEPNEHTPDRFRKLPLRSPGHDTFLVTSRLMPDRIRWMDPIARRKIFSNHTSALFFSRTEDTASWGQSRLAIEVLGYWDENCYPAYYEDSDWRWRGFATGFRSAVPPAHIQNGIHYRRTTRSMGHAGRVDASDFGAGVVNPQELARMHNTLNAFYKGIGHILLFWYPKWYVIHKWMGRSTGKVRGPYLPNLDELWPMNPRAAEQAAKPLLPIDVWVWDLDMRETIATAARLSVEFFEAHPEMSKYGHEFNFMPNATRTYLRARTGMTKNLFFPSSYLDGDALKKLPSEMVYPRQKL